MSPKPPWRPSQPASATSNKRGQTLQDFILGVTVFILTVTFVFGIFPGFLEPLTAGTDTADRVQSDRIAQTMVQKQSVSGQQNVLSASDLRSITSNSQSDLRDRYSLPQQASINVTVRDIETNEIVAYGGQKLATDEKSLNRSAGSVARVIKLDDDSICRPGCRLVVKVW
jgi:hypothetical protein